MEQALYLFCLARGGLVPQLDVEGLADDSPLLLEDFSDVIGVVCEVPVNEFSGPAAEAKLRDLAWVGPRAIRHDRVIEQAMGYSPVLPARFGTLFSSREALDRLVKRNISEIIRFFDHVTGKDEWAVKALVSRAELRDRLFGEKRAGRQESLASLPPGARYFKEKQILAEVEKEVGRWLKEATNVVGHRLTECAADWRKRDIVLSTQEGTGRETVVNWAFLVDRRLLGDFEARIDAANREYREHGLLFELSGPWPPYSFAPPLELEPEA